jgi:hypothetical protein
MNLASFFAYAGVLRRNLKLLHNFTPLFTSGFIRGLTSCSAVYEEWKEKDKKVPEGVICGTRGGHF